MSRIGNKPINVPEGVEVKLDGHHITVKGPKGTLEKDLHKNMQVAIENNVITIANPVKHRFLQRRKFTRIKFIEDLELTNGDVVHKIRTLDLSAGGMKVRTTENIDIEKDYNVSIKLSDEQVINCKYQLIRVEKGDGGLYTISGRFTSLSNIDKMTLVQFCMKKDMENLNKSGKDE